MTFTLAHGFAVSLALHGALVLPFVLPVREEPADEPALLVVELNGLVADTQSEQAVQQQTKGQAAQQEQQAAEAAQQAQQAAPDAPPQETAEEAERALPPPPSPEQQDVQAPSQTSAPQAEAKPGAAGTVNVKGADEQKQARTIAQDQDDAERMRAYSRILTRKVQDHLVYPDAGRKSGLQGTAKVAFSLEADGTIRPGTLHIAKSSGQPRLDANALKSVEASAPFAPPPRPFGLTIDVGYDREK